MLISESGACRRWPQSPSLPQARSPAGLDVGPGVFSPGGKGDSWFESSFHFPGSHSPPVWELCSEQKVAPSSRARLETSQRVPPCPITASRAQHGSIPPSLWFQQREHRPPLSHDSVAPGARPVFLNLSWKITKTAYIVSAQTPSCFKCSQFVLKSKKPHSWSWTSADWIRALLPHPRCAGHTREIGRRPRWVRRWLGW